MKTASLSGLVALAALFGCLASEAQSPAGAPPWRIIIANDTCPDVTWGFTEAQTRKAFADLIAAHLDEMTRTDAQPPENRNHYNATAFVEVEAFLEKYPGRKDELVSRVREGRLCVSPFLCNSLWGSQSVEGALRTFYPARRFERDHGVRFEVAEHIELPSLPWGMATLLSGCGIRWASVPFLDYDTTFKGLQNPPLFRFEGPDGSEVRVILDRWASLKANYRQGGHLLQDTRRVTGEWLPHYQQLGSDWPLRTLLASGTHSDINPNSWKQARGFADGIIAYNAAGTNALRLVNGTLGQFCSEVDATEKARPFLPRLRGCFGHSWELWPVSLAHTVAAARENERVFLVAESLLALASLTKPELAARTRAARERAEWCWAMLGDHAWNGTDWNNKRHNAALRRAWADQLRAAGEGLTRQAWDELGLESNPYFITVFNPLSFTNDIRVTCDPPVDATGVEGLPSALRLDAGRQLGFVAPRVPPFGFREFRLATNPTRAKPEPLFSTTDDSVEGPFYRLRADSQNGGLASVFHKPTGQELVVASGRTLCQTVFSDDQDRLLSNVACRAQSDGVVGELRVTGRAGELRVTNIITLHAGLDRVDFDVRIEKPPSTNAQRLLHFFPITDGVKALRVETIAAVLRPSLQPDGDLLPGADTRRIAVQGFVDCSPPGRAGVTLAPLDAFLLRLDQGTLAFEALGNDQNWKEVTRDQDGVRHFRFRYSLRAHAPGYDNAAAIAWSRSVAAPVTWAPGRLPGRWLNRAHLAADPARAVVTCLKPADAGTVGRTMVRLWETSGQSSPAAVGVWGYGTAQQADLLEREQGALELKDAQVMVPLRGFGFAGLLLHR